MMRSMLDASNLGVHDLILPPHNNDGGHDGHARRGDVPSEARAAAPEVVAEPDRDEDVERGGGGEADREDELRVRGAVELGRVGEGRRGRGLTSKPWTNPE